MFGVLKTCAVDESRKIVRIGGRVSGLEVFQVKSDASEDVLMPETVNGQKAILAILRFLRNLSRWEGDQAICCAGSLENTAC